MFFVICDDLFFFSATKGIALHLLKNDREKLGHSVLSNRHDHDDTITFGEEDQEFAPAGVSAANYLVPLVESSNELQLGTIPHQSTIVNKVAILHLLRESLKRFIHPRSPDHPSFKSS